MEYSKARTVQSGRSHTTDGKIEISQSDAIVSRVNNDELRTTKSSPHQNLKLHHTRSFSEICHLHPSSSDVSCSVLCPKLKNIEALQQEIRRPESILEMADLSAQNSEEEIEDIIEAQEKGDEAMKLFFEANINVPLDGGMSSSSSSVETMDSDLASEHELIVATWESEPRDSFTSGMEKRFLTPSGMLLYREKQVDSMLDTKRLKLTPSNAERPMSPLAARSSDEDNIKYRMAGYERGNRRNNIVSDSESEDQDEGHEASPSTVNQEYASTKMDPQPKQTFCDCGLTSKFQDMQRLVSEYEVQCEELVNRGKQLCQEMNTLKKDNANMHKEQNRLQFIIKECHKQEEALKANMKKTTTAKEKRIEELNMNIRNLENKVKERDENIIVLTKEIENRNQEISKYDDILKEISHESKALIEALAKELGDVESQSLQFNENENKERIAKVLKKRRYSLQDDFNNFSQHVYNSRHNEQGSNATDASINNLQNHLRVNFQDRTTECKKALSHVQQTERGVEHIQQKAVGLETVLLETTMKEDQVIHGDKQDLQWQLKELTQQYEKVVQENSMLKKDRAKSLNEREQVQQEHEKNTQDYNRTKFENNDRIKELYEEKSQANAKLQELQDIRTDIKKRLENTYREKTALETELGKLKGKYCKDDEQSEYEKGENEQFKARNNDLRNQLTEQAKLIDCLVQRQKIKEHPTGVQYKESEKVKLMEETSKAATRETNPQKTCESVQARLNQLSCLTKSLSDKMEKANEKMDVMTTTKYSSNMTVTENDKNTKQIVSCGDKVLCEMKAIYEEHFDSVQRYLTKQQQQNKYLKEQLVIKENDEEMEKCYIVSLKKAIEVSQNELRVCKTKYQVLKKELRELKDQIIIGEAEQRLDAYYGRMYSNNDGFSKQLGLLRMKQPQARGQRNNLEKQNHQENG